MKLKKSVLVTLSEDEKRSLGRLSAWMCVGLVGSDDTPIYCDYMDCVSCPFRSEESVIGSSCLINQIVRLKDKLRFILNEIKEGKNFEI